MLQGFLIGHEKGGMEDRVNLPSGGDAEAEGHAGDDLFYFEWTGSFHLELLRSIHVEVGCFEPDLISNLPGCEPRGYLFPHLLLSHFVGSLGIVSGSRCYAACVIKSLAAHTQV